MNKTKDYKKCHKCAKTKPISDFNKNKVKIDGLDIYCKNCNNLKTKVYRELNKETITAKKRVFYANNKEKVNGYAAKYRQNNRNKLRVSYRAWVKANPDKSKAATSSWQSKNKTKIKNYLVEKRKSDPLFKLNHNTRVMINKAFNRGSFKKNIKNK